jgi:ferredoxin
MQMEEIPARIKIVLGGKEHVVDYERDKPILEVALDAGLDAPWSCREGLCRACIARLHCGDIQMLEDAALSEADKANQLILTCQSYPTSRASVYVEYVDVE